MRTQLIAFALIAGLVGTAQAATDTFMHIDGIPGDALVIGHVDDIVLTSYTQTFATKACSKVVAVKFLDRASPLLIGRAAGNVIIPTVIISIRKAGENPVDFYKATLESVLIDRVDVLDTGAELTEQLVLRPRNIRIEFRPQRADGSFGAPIVTSIECS